MEKITIIDDVVRVYITSAQDIDTLENNINKFLIDYKITPQQLVDIKLTEGAKYYTAMVIYKATIKRTNLPKFNK